MIDYVKTLTEIINGIDHKSDSIDIGKSLLIDYGIDSIQLVQLIISIEETFGFEFDVDDMIIDETITLQHFIDVIEKHLHCLE